MLLSVRDSSKKNARPKCVNNFLIDVLHCQLTCWESICFMSPSVRICSQHPCPAPCDLLWWVNARCLYTIDAPTPNKGCLGWGLPPPMNYQHCYCPPGQWGWGQKVMQPTVLCINWLYKPGRKLFKGLDQKIFAIFEPSLHNYYCIYHMFIPVCY